MTTEQVNAMSLEDLQAAYLKLHSENEQREQQEEILRRLVAILDAQEYGDLFDGTYLYEKVKELPRALIQLTLRMKGAIKVNEGGSLARREEIERLTRIVNVLIKDPQLELRIEGSETTPTNGCSVAGYDLPPDPRRNRR
jgi:hypothetical protein